MITDYIKIVTHERKVWLNKDMPQPSTQPLTRGVYTRLKLHDDTIVWLDKDNNEIADKIAKEWIEREFIKTVGNP